MEEYVRVLPAPYAVGFGERVTEQVGAGGAVEVQVIITAPEEPLVTHAVEGPQDQ